MINKLLFSGIVFLVSANICFANTKKMDMAYADIINHQGQTIGNAIFKQGSEGVVIRIKIHNLPEGVHGMHLHEVGDCSDHQRFDSAKEPIVTPERVHGFLNPDGPLESDLPNLIVAKDGTAHMELYTNMISIAGVAWKPELLDNDGSALIIREHEDDHKSQPVGNAGARIACGVIAPMQEVNLTPAPTLPKAP